MSLALALAEATKLLDLGDADGSRKGALDVLHLATASEDVHMQANALTHLAHCDRVVSRFRRAHDSAQRAAQLYKSIGDDRGEAFALTTVSYAASSLGRNEDAVEAGLLSVHLSNALTDLQLRAVAHNNLGIAYFWCRRFDKAMESFDAATAAARESKSFLSEFQPLMNAACAESWRLCSERFLTGQMPSAAQLDAHVQAAVRAVGTAPPAALVAGLQITSVTIISLFSALSSCWNGHALESQRHLEDAHVWSKKFKSITWLNALERWVRAEVGLQANDVEQGVELLKEFIALATEVEHEQLACVGHMVLAQTYEQQGNDRLATAELRALRRREFQIRAESLDSREKVAQWQLEIRENARRIESLRADSTRLERLTHEDSLTQMPNRRFVEKRLSEHLSALRERGQAVSVVFIDVDRFKRVNDQFSHRVGDQVLQKIGEVLRNSVRDGDVAARLAGDEFILVLPNTDVLEATQIAERVRELVKCQDWGSLAPGLQVTVTAGTSQADASDSVASVLGKSDERMYANKARQTES